MTDLERNSLQGTGNSSEATLVNCYCGPPDVAVQTGPTLLCSICQHVFHSDCLKSGHPSPMAGDIFFKLVCANCGENGQELVTRVKLSWQTVVHLALYNLQLHGGGKYGYYKWKENICSYIDKYWQHFFGYERKKGSNWHGTVAGTLSTGSPHVFFSGASELKEAGWWKLTVNKPPTAAKAECRRQNAGRRQYKEPAVALVTEGSRHRRTGGSLVSAIELKARRDTIAHGKKRRRQSAASDASLDQSPGSDLSLSIQSSSDDMIPTNKSSDFQMSLNDENSSHPAHFGSPLSGQGYGISSSTVVVKTERAESPVALENEGDHLRPKKMTVFSESVSALLGDTSDDDLDIDPCALSPGSRLRGDVMTSVYSSQQSTGSNLWPTECLPTPSARATTSHSTRMSPPGGMEASQVIVKQEPITDEYYSDLTPTRSSPLIWPVADSSLVPTPGTSADMSSPSYFGDVTRSSTNQSETDSGSNLEETQSDVSVKPKQKRKRKAKIKTNEGSVHDENSQVPQNSLVRMSIYEERCLLRQLHDRDGTDPLMRRLSRKLIVRQLKRERGLPSFDVDVFVNDSLKTKCYLYGKQFINTQAEDQETDNALEHTAATKQEPVNVLDRFQNVNCVQRYDQGASFLNKLVGAGDEQLSSIRSPYTARLLKPFIRRDYETRPPKMRLLQQIHAYSHRNDASWTAPTPPPIDYCYMQPQHIAAVNILCGEFFWPSIDVSECLQYPDFTCVVLYRKCVVGFAFMVPDVKYNEAYISFLFTHPEWRGAGIATFMIYHLIQTCMGKDVTLHVSASNAAMLLYQKFGFKAEELILDFYDKYFPIDSRDCRHAFFLRLKR